MASGIYAIVAPSGKQYIIRASLIGRRHSTDRIAAIVAGKRRAAIVMQDGS